MATITLDSTDVAVRLSSAEKLFGLRPHDLRLPLAAVSDVTVHDDGLAAARGVRAPGLAVPGRTKIGTWRRRGARAFVSVRRGVPAVRVRFSGADVDEIVVASPHADAIAGAIHAAAGRPGDGPSRQVAIPSGDVTLSGTPRDARAPCERASAVPRDTPRTASRRASIT